MAETGIEVRVDASRALAALEEFSIRLKPETLLKLIGQTYLFWINRAFREQGFPGRRWPGLSANTLANPERAGRPPLVGNPPTLSRSFDARGISIGGNRVTVGTNVQYASYHQYGTAGPYPIVAVNAKALKFWTVSGLTFRRKVMHPGLPARPFVPDDALAVKIAQDALAAYVDKIVEEIRRGGT